MGEEKHDGLRNAFHHILGVYLTDSEGKGLRFGAFVTLFQRLHFPLLHMLTSPLPSASSSSPIEVALSLLHRPKDDLLCLASLSQASRELVWNVSVIFLARCLFLSQTILPTPSSSLPSSSSSSSPARRKGINISLNLFLELLLASDRIKLWKSFASQECLFILKLFHTEKAFIFTQRSSSSSSSRDVERIASENKEALAINVTTELSPFAPKDPKVPFNEAEMPFEETVVDITSDVFTEIALPSPSFTPLLRPRNRDLVFPSSLRHQPTYPIHEPTVQNTSSSPPPSSSFADEVCHFSAPNAALVHNNSLSATGLSFNTNLFLPSSAPLLALLHEQTANTTTITNSPSSSSSSLAVPVSDAPIWSLLEDLERQTEAILRPSSRSRKRKEPFRRQLDEVEEERGELEGARDGITLAASESVEVSYFNILNENEDEVSTLKSTSKGKKRKENRTEKKTLPRVRRKSAALSRLELLEQLEAQILGSD